ncbi:conserved hypothetical protein [Trichinella spiralis]|uniref:hypothetical protein n=1 Tax=Trichinella spiralis TaxID=6334 RepID=UPI0001EFD1BF|nr:conserved hypothetical protein [Trichinella spiralis]
MFYSAYDCNRRRPTTNNCCAPLDNEEEEEGRSYRKLTERITVERGYHRQRSRDSLALAIYGGGRCCYLRINIVFLFCVLIARMMNPQVICHLVMIVAATLLRRRTSPPGKAPHYNGGLSGKLS